MNMLTYLVIQSQEEDLKFISIYIHIYFQNYNILCHYLELENKMLDLSCVLNNKSGGQVNNITCHNTWKT